MNEIFAFSLSTFSLIIYIYIFELDSFGIIQ